MLDQNKKIKVNGINLNVLITGEGPEVLLLHGFPDCHDVWRKQIPVLVEAGYRVIAPDTRGCGDSDMPSRKKDYDIKLLVSDVIGILDALDIDKVRLVAHDWGGAIGWQVVLAHPERIERYAVISTGHPQAYANAPMEQKIKGWYVLFFQIPVLSDWALQACNWWLFRKITGYAEESSLWIEKLQRPGRFKAALNYYRANLHIVLTKFWPQATIPVMGIWSDGDKFLAESQMIDSKEMVDAPFRYERIDNANHWAQLTAAPKVNELLIDYLA